MGLRQGQGSAHDTPDWPRPRPHRRPGLRNPYSRSNFQAVKALTAWSTTFCSEFQKKIRISSKQVCDLFEIGKVDLLYDMQIFGLRKVFYLSWGFDQPRILHVQARHPTDWVKCRGYPSQCRISEDSVRRNVGYFRFVRHTCPSAECSQQTANINKVKQTMQREKRKTISRP